MGIDTCGAISLKKVRREDDDDDDDDDRISSLPDDVLCRILYLLPTKQAVATTVLSKRWNYLFALLPHLSFDDSQTGSHATFAVFVTNVIRALLTKSTQICNFYLNCTRGTYEASLISSWISAAASSRNLQILSVSAGKSASPVPLPPQLFHCRMLSDLTLRGGSFSFSVPSDVLFPSLKSLWLSNLILTNDGSIKRLLSGCIVLECLHLAECAIDTTIGVLEVSVASLKELCFNLNDGDYELVLNAPSLEYFECNSYVSRGYTGDALNSLERAEVEVYLKDEHFGDEKVSQLIKMLFNAKFLSLSGDILQALENQLPTFDNLTKLMVNTGDASGWLSLPNFLDHAPHLQVLSFHRGLYDYHGNFLDFPSYLLQWVPTCVSSQLKEVRIHYFKGKEEEFKMVNYFLKNAEVLEKMTITSTPYHLSDYFPVTKRLLKLPRCSRNCRIVFMDEEDYDL